MDGVSYCTRQTERSDCNYGNKAKDLQIWWIKGEEGGQLDILDLQ